MTLNSQPYLWCFARFGTIRTKSNTPPWVFFTLFKLYKCCQIAQRTTFSLIEVILCGLQAIWRHKPWEYKTFCITKKYKSLPGFKQIYRNSIMWKHVAACMLYVKIYDPFLKKVFFAEFAQILRKYYLCQTTWGLIMFM